MPSIRRKISSGYFALATVMVAFAAFAYGDLRFLERSIDDGAAISGFREETLEMRRYEKNHFLFRTEADRGAALEHAAAAAARLAREGERFASVATRAELDQLVAALTRYRQLLENHRGVSATGRDGLESSIRELGHAVSEQTEAMAEREREVLAGAVRQAQQALALSVLLVTLAGVGGGHLLSRAVAKPLNALESALGPVAEGRFRELKVTARDQEIASFVRAFNRMLNELEARRRQLLHSEKLASLGVLVSGVAHELNNPLTNISTSCQLLLEELEQAPPEQQRAWLAQIDSETDRARDIVRALLDFARHRPFCIEPVALDVLLEQSLVLVRKQLPAAVTVTQSIPAGLEALADRQRLQQVFINLIKNAGETGCSEITITGRRARWSESGPAAGACVVGAIDAAARERPLAVITVADDGPGVAPAILTRIFDPFFTTHDTGHGMGLGLYVVQQIVEDHGGCLGVESRTGEGTRFTLWLPCPAEGFQDD